jgi:hypothetical protein
MLARDSGYALLQSIATYPCPSARVSSPRPIALLQRTWPGPYQEYQIFNIDVHTDHLGILLEWGFCFSRAGVGTGTLHLYQASGCCCYCSPPTQTRTHMHMYRHTYICMCTHIHIYTQMCMCTHYTHRCTHLHTCIHILWVARMYRCTPSPKSHHPGSLVVASPMLSEDTGLETPPLGVGVLSSGIWHMH